MAELEAELAAAAAARAALEAQVVAAGERAAEGEAGAKTAAAKEKAAEAKVDARTSHVIGSRRGYIPAPLAWLVGSRAWDIPPYVTRIAHRYVASSPSRAQRARGLAPLDTAHLSPVVQPVGQVFTPEGRRKGREF